MLCLVLIHHLPNPKFSPKLSGPPCFLWGGQFFTVNQWASFHYCPPFYFFSFLSWFEAVTKAAEGRGRFSVKQGCWFPVVGSNKRWLQGGMCLVEVHSERLCFQCSAHSLQLPPVSRPALQRSPSPLSQASSLKTRFTGSHECVSFFPPAPSVAFHSICATVKLDTMLIGVDTESHYISFANNRKIVDDASHVSHQNCYCVLQQTLFSRCLPDSGLPCGIVGALSDI